MSYGSYARGLRTSVITFTFAVIVAALFMSLSFAHAAPVGATFSAPKPASGATPTSKPTWISVQADDTAPIISVTMIINGVPVTSYIDYPVGHFYFDEETEQDVWVTDDVTLVRVISYNTQSRVVNGVNTVRATVTSSNGTSEYVWSFNYGTASSVSTVTPTPGGILPDSPSHIMACLSSPSSSFSSTMKLDGVVVATTYDAQTKTCAHTPTSPLGAGIHTIEFSAKDDANGTATRTWSFTVSPPMSTGWDCLGCHAAYSQTHPLSGCEDCHDHAYAPAGRHGGEVPTVAGCTADGIINPDGACHRLDHGGEMGRGTNAFTCTQCHNAEFPRVPGHSNEAVLASSLAAPTNGCFGTSCHTRSLVLEHAKYPRNSELKYQCDLCHGPNAPQRVKDALAEQDMRCFACHQGFHEE